MKSTNLLYVFSTEEVCMTPKVHFLLEVADQSGLNLNVPANPRVHFMCGLHVDPEHYVKVYSSTIRQFKYLQSLVYASQTQETAFCFTFRK